MNKERVIETKALRYRVEMRVRSFSLKNLFFSLQVSHSSFILISLLLFGGFFSQRLICVFYFELLIAVNVSVMNKKIVQTHTQHTSRGKEKRVIARALLV